MFYKFVYQTLANMNNYLNIIEETKCTGCSACANSCPFDAIEMKEDEFGFLYPIVDKNKCKSCGKCKKACPILNQKRNNNLKKPKCYAIMANDEIRMKSSSGGMFTLLAQTILNSGGYICGAAYNKDFSVSHTIINNIDELEKLKGSKYLQSTIGDCYKKIQTLLKDNKQVLFTGTPCQVAGLNNYLGKFYDNLYTAELLCHGTPSYKIFKKYLDENYNISDIEAINFRDKKNNWCSTKLTFYNKDGTIIIKDKNNDSYEAGFHQGLFNRKSCAPCQFAKLPRQADITIADWWGIKELAPEMDDKKGTSLVLINNEKGELLLNKISKLSILKIKETPLDYAKKSINKTISKPIKAHKNRAYFFENFNKLSFSQNVNYALQQKYDIGIVGLYTGNNYGTSIQYYNLYTVISNLGYTVLMISRPRNYKLDEEPEKYTIPKRFKENPYPKISLINKIYNNKSQMKELNNIVDKFIVGSDQFFRNSLFKQQGEYMSLDWVNDTKSKNGYAISFGLENFEGDEKTKSKIAHDLQKFDHITIREKSGIKLLQEEFGVKATEAIDPCFLGNHENYEILINKSKLKLPNEYLFAYILDENKEKKEIIKTAAKKLNLKPYIINDPNKKNKNIYIEDWLKAIKNAKYIITDSYHGVCMSLIFEKEFLYIPNPKRGITRFETLNENFGIRDRMLNSKDELSKKLTQKMDYKQINERIKIHKEKSLQYLKQILEDNSKQTNINNEPQINYEQIEEETNKQLYIKNSKYYILYKLKYEYYRLILNIFKDKKYNQIKNKKDKYKKIISKIKKYTH